MLVAGDRRLAEPIARRTVLRISEYLWMDTGIGIELKPDSLQNVSPPQWEIATRLHVDGSVVDQRSAL